MVALTLFDLRRQGSIQELFMAGTNGTKFPGIRKHLREAIENRYQGIHSDLKTFPEDTVERVPQRNQWNDYLAGSRSLPAVK